MRPLVTAFVAVAALALAPAAAPAATFAVESATGSVRLVIDGQHDGRGGLDTATARATIRWEMTGKRNRVDLGEDALPDARRDPEWRAAPLIGIRGTATGTATVLYADGRTASCQPTFSRLTKAFFERDRGPSLELVVARRDARSLIVAIDGLDPFAPFDAFGPCGPVLAGLPAGIEPPTGRETRGTAVSLGRLERATLGSTLSIGIRRTTPLTGFANGRETTVATVVERAKLVLRRTG